MMTQFSPRPNFECLLERTNASGQCDESIGKLCHKRFAFMHRRGNTEITESLMSDFLLHHELRDHPNYFAASLQNGIGHGSHQPNRRPAVYQSDPLCRKLFPEIGCRLCVLAAHSQARSREHAVTLSLVHLFSHTAISTPLRTQQKKRAASEDAALSLLTFARSSCNEQFSLR